MMRLVGSRDIKKKPSKQTIGSGKGSQVDTYVWHLAYHVCFRHFYIR